MSQFYINTINIILYVAVLIFTAPCSGRCRLSVWVFVTFLYCAKTAKPIVENFYRLADLLFQFSQHQTTFWYSDMQSRPQWLVLSIGGA